jgi:hypothetical protein
MRLRDVSASKQLTARSPLACRLVAVTRRAKWRTVLVSAGRWLRRWRWVFAVVRRGSERCVLRAPETETRRVPLASSRRVQERPQTFRDHRLQLSGGGAPVEAQQLVRVRRFPLRSGLVRAPSTPPAPLPSRSWPACMTDGCRWVRQAQMPLRGG